MNVCVLTKFQELGASSRLRFYQYIPCMAGEDRVFKFFVFIKNFELSSKYESMNYSIVKIINFYLRRLAALWRCSHYSFVWIEKEALPFFPLRLELFLLRGAPYVLDYDDAVFHTYDQHCWAIVRKLYGRRLDGLMARAKLVVCGNQYLADRARTAGAQWVEVLPTVIDLDRYPYPQSVTNSSQSDTIRLVWIGSPSTAKYLHLIHGALRDLARRYSFVLRVIGADVRMDGVQIECVKWTEDTEVAAISECTVGLMPLLDTSWERGKCGYKLIQYMACGLPVVASNVGVNSEIVKNEVNGILTISAEDWVSALERLLIDGELRRHMGKAGRQRVEDEYCIQKTGPKLARWLTRVAEGR